MKLTKEEKQDELLYYYDGEFINNLSDNEIDDLFLEIVKKYSVDYEIKYVIDNHYMDYILINTPDGYKEINDFFIKNRNCLNIIFDNGINLECSVDHLVETKNGWVKSINLNKGDYVLSKDGYVAVNDVLPLEYQEVYDLEVNSNQHRYWSNNVSSHNTAKTFVTCYYITRCLIEHKYDKYILTKPIQEAGEKLGALPGNVDEKIDPYYESFRLNLMQMMSKQDYLKLIEKEIIENKPLAYMRGISINHGLMILDEAQNATMKQLMLFITRMGKDSKVIILGDIRQYDIRKNDVALPFMMENIVNDIDRIGIFEFTDDDIVRNKLLIEITKKYEILKNNGEIPRNF